MNPYYSLRIIAIPYKSLLCVTHLYYALQSLNCRYKCILFLINPYYCLQVHAIPYQSILHLVNPYHYLQVLTMPYKPLLFLTKPSICPNLTIKPREILSMPKPHDKTTVIAAMEVNTCISYHICV